MEDNLTTPTLDNECDVSFCQDAERLPESRRETNERGIRREDLLSRGKKRFGDGTDVGRGISFDTADVKTPTVDNSCDVKTPTCDSDHLLAPLTLSVTTCRRVWAFGVYQKHVP